MSTRTFITLVIAAMLGAFGACATNPVTGERQLTLVSEAQEIDMGRAASQQVEQTIGLVDDAALQAYVQRLGMLMATASERPKLPWTFRVVDDPTPNAFALPGGFIYVTRGMMNLMDSEAELATVLGHEIAHVTARHGVTALTRQQLASLGLGIGGILFPEIQPFGQAASAGLDLLFLKYGRDAERQADELGFGYARQQDYDVREMADVFDSLQRIGNAEERSALPTWLASHPAPAERIENVETRLAALGKEIGPKARLGRAEYLGQIDNLVYGENPRHGFFREGVFFHPDLRFRFAVPEQWATQNLTRAVLAISPNRDAAVQLTLADAASPSAAARQFFAQQGIQSLGASEERINGFPAVVAQFQAATQQGAIVGLISWLQYEGRTYQLVTYAAGERYRAYDSVFRSIIGSFSRLTDPEYLNVQPMRIDIVRLDRAMSLTDFNRRYPSEIPIERLAILNQVTDLNAALGAGTLVKRVVRG